MLDNRVLVGLLLVLALLGSPVVAEEDNLTLTVYVSGAQPGQGQALGALFNSAEQYLKQPLARQTQPIDANGSVIFQFDELPAGTYAVTVIYDEDSNGELNTGLLGIPTELVGMSNNAKGLFGPPSFEKTAFLLEESISIDIVLSKANE
ncbi:MAG: DUF2141 domain-containing protein [Candidatus Competibacteraceae bacterium]|nr:DUF2141 domain-containing protein [Candidatus Competibacteraceae bacterium]